MQSAFRRLSGSGEAHESAPGGAEGSADARDDAEGLMRGGVEAGERRPLIDKGGDDSKDHQKPATGFLRVVFVSACPLAIQAFAHSFNKPWPHVGLWKASPGHLPAPQAFAAAAAWMVVSSGLIILNK